MNCIGTLRNANIIENCKNIMQKSITDSHEFVKKVHNNQKVINKHLLSLSINFPRLLCYCMYRLYNKAFAQKQPQNLIIL